MSISVLRPAGNRLDSHRIGAEVRSVSKGQKGQKERRRPRIELNPGAAWSLISAPGLLQVERATIEGERRTAEADLGPVRYLATLLGAADEVVFRWFILVVALLLDPAAVLLLLAATRR